MGQKRAVRTPVQGSVGGDTIRDHLANRRTMLAWARTAITVMALGFVVSRFGLLLRELKPVLSPRLPDGVSTGLGAALVAIGGVIVILATVDYLLTERAIDHREYRWSPVLECALGMLLALVAGILAVYLLITG